MIRHRVKFKEQYIPLRISKAIILLNISAENRGGWDESHEQSFRRMQ
jgi:hypothetical protein